MRRAGGRKRPFGIILGFVLAFTAFAMLSRKLVLLLEFAALVAVLGAGALAQSPLPSVRTSPVPQTSVAPGPAFTWQQADVPGIGKNGIIPSYMAVNGSGDMSLLGNAYPDQRKSRAWHSTDGITWTPAKLDWKAREGEGGTASGIAVVDDQFVAVGANSHGWTALSPTGETWKVDKKALKQARWYTTDQIFWRPERQDPYRPFTDDDRTALEARFAEHGRTLDRP